MNARILHFPTRLRLVAGINRVLSDGHSGDSVLVLKRLRSRLLTERVSNLRLNPEAPFPLKQSEAIFNSNLSH
jgi:hypothetical protein